MLTFDEILKLPNIASKGYYNYSIHKDPTDQKIYNLDHKTRTIVFVRDPLNTKFTLGQTVLVKPLGEYGEIGEVKQDLEWGNHRYEVGVFNDNVINCVYRDEYELEPVL